MTLQRYFLFLKWIIFLSIFLQDCDCILTRTRPINGYWSSVSKFTSLSGYQNLRVETCIPSSNPAVNQIKMYQYSTSGSVFWNWTTSQTIPSTGLKISTKAPYIAVSTAKIGGQYNLSANNTVTNLGFHNYSTFHSIFIDSIKNGSTIFYYFLVSNTSATNFTTTICYKHFPSTNCTFILNYTQKTVAAYINQYKFLHVIRIDSQTNASVLQILAQNGTSMANYSFSGIGTTYHLESSYNYILIGIDNKLYSMDSNTMQILWTVNNSQTFTSANLIYPWACALFGVSNSSIRQYHIKTGKYFDLGSYPLNYMDMYFNTSVYTVSLANLSGPYYNLFDANDEYSCSPQLSTSNCTVCESGYTLTASKTCLGQYPDNIYNLTNSTSSLTIPIPVPTNTSNTTTNTSINATNTTNTTTNNTNTTNTSNTSTDINNGSNSSNSSSNTSNTTNNNNSNSTNSTNISNQINNTKKQPIILIDYLNQIYCSQRCKQCSVNKNNCTKCSKFYSFMGQGYCDTQTNTKIAALTFALMNAFKSTKMMGFYAFLHNFDLYDYHKLNYDGIMKEVLDFTRFMKEKQWELVPVNPIPDSYDQIWFQKLYYLPFTNTNFTSAERKDLTFLQNTKQYFTLFIPTTIIFFVFFNKLFYCFFKQKISLVFRCFAFWMHLLGVILFNDIERFAYLGYNQISILFHHNVSSKILQAFSVSFLGIWLPLCLSFYFLCYSLYGSKSLYFFANMRISLPAATIMTIKYVFKPIIQGFLHTFLWACPITQLSLLSLMQILSFSSISSFELKYSLIRSKRIFSVECLLQLSTVIINILLFFKYIQFSPQNVENNKYNDNLQLRSRTQYYIRTLVYISGTLLSLSILLGVDQILMDLVHNKMSTQSYLQLFKSKTNGRKLRNKNMFNEQSLARKIKIHSQKLKDNNFKFKKTMKNIGKISMQKNFNLSKFVVRTNRRNK